MTRASNILEQLEQDDVSFAQKAADGILARLDKLGYDDVEVETVLDSETGVMFIELERGKESVTLAAANVEAKQLLIVVSDDDDSIAIDLEPLNPPTADGYIDFSDSKWLTKRVVDAVFKSADMTNEAKALTASGRTSVLAIIHHVPKDDEMLVLLRARAVSLGLDAMTTAKEIIHIDTEPVAGKGAQGLYKVGSNG